MKTLNLTLNIITILLWIIIFIKMSIIYKKLNFIDKGIRLINMILPITMLGVSYIYLMIVWWIIYPNNNIPYNIKFEMNIFHLFVPTTLIFIIMYVRRLILSKYRSGLRLIVNEKNKKKLYIYLRNLLYFKIKKYDNIFNSRK
jgi:hypothetical protein